MFDGLKLFKKNDTSDKVKISCKMDKDLKEKIKGFGGEKNFYELLTKVLEIDYVLSENKTLYLEKIDANDYALSFYYGHDIECSRRDRIDFNISKWDNELCITLSGLLDKGLHYEKKYIHRLGKIDCDISFKKKEDIVLKREDSITYKRFEVVGSCYFITVGYDKRKIQIINNKRYINDLIYNEGELADYLISVFKSGKINLVDICDKIYKLSFDGSTSLNLGLISNDKEVCQYSYSKYEDDDNYKREYRIDQKKNSVMYTRYTPRNKGNYGFGKFNIYVINGDYTFRLEIVNDSKEDIILENEKELREYLSKLEFPIKIEEVYKKICCISLKNINDYYKINICFLNKHIVLEEISLENGKLQLLRVTRDGKEINVDKDNNEFSYRKNEDKLKVFVNLQNDLVTRCEYISDKVMNIETDNMMENPLWNLINDAKKERVKIKKLINDMNIS